MVERTTYTEAEIEDQRQEALRDYDGETQDAGPGTFDCHEALHMATFLMNAVARDLMGHQSIAANPEWFKLAHEAHSALFDLYQSIGDKHLTRVEADSPSQT